jgi:hypothetical protein
MEFELYKNFILVLFSLYISIGIIVCEAQSPIEQ